MRRNVPSLDNQVIEAETKAKGLEPWFEYLPLSGDQVAQDVYMDSLRRSQVMLSLIPEDFERRQLPPALVPHRKKLFGLTINPERLSEIRNERRPNSRYASIENCRHEVNEAESMMRRAGVRWLSTTTKSIEEIATTILQEVRPDRLEY